MDFLKLQQLDDLFFEADQLIREKKFTEAITILESIIIDSPEYGKAYNHLAWIFETQYREYAKAEDLYRKCIAINPEYTPVYLNISVTLSTLGKYADQQKILEAALLVPGIDKSSMYNELGIMHELTGKFDEAIHHFKEAIRFSLVNANIDTSMASMERCKRKKEILA